MSSFDDIFVAPAGMSAARAARLLPVVGSDDATHLLGSLPAPPRQEPTYFGPDEARQWVLGLGLNGVLGRETILNVFERSGVASQSDVTLYGRSVPEEGWTYVGAGGAPDRYDRLAVGVDVLESQRHARTPDELRSVLEAVTSAAKVLGATVEPRSVLDEAVFRARRRAGLVQQFGEARAAIVLAAPSSTTFKGKSIWDVMLSLGLRWGDGDLFHWESARQALGELWLFSVRTTTQPGYFLPEEIAGDRLSVENLVFEFSIPRSGAPATVCDRMLVAAEYAQRRLGGALLDEYGETIIPDERRARVATIVSRLEASGLSPGHSDTMRLIPRG